MRWAVRSLLERMAAERPVVFVIDDLQWAEPTFLELVEYVADLAHDVPILLACMARPELLDDHPAWAGEKLNATSILLEPLNAEECGKFVANLLADDAVDAVVRVASLRPPKGTRLRGGDHGALDRRRSARAEGRSVDPDGRPG